jgi:Putative metallopeptidase
MASLLLGGALIALLTGFQIRAQTPDQAWSTFLGGNQAELQPNRIRIEYAEPEHPQVQPFRDMLIEHRPLEKVQEIFSPLRLPMDLTVRTKECGISNAWYRRPDITICYEYLRDIVAMAPKDMSPDGISPMDAIVGQFLFTAAHEMGHAVFDYLDIPLFGRPEDDADQFAAHVLIKIGQQDAHRLISGAAYTYNEYIKNPTVTVRVAAFADVHGAPVQRLYNLLCLAYGENPDTFSDVVDKGYLPKSRVPACKQEWGEVDFAFQKLIYPYIDRKLLNDVLSKSWAPDRSAPPPRMTDVPQAVH